MNLRRIVMDVDRSTKGPDIVDLASSIEGVKGVEAVNITVTEIDAQTVGMDITVEGDGIEWPELASAIEETGAMVHSVDQVVAGSRIVEGIPRSR